MMPQDHVRRIQSRETDHALLITKVEAVRCPQHGSAPELVRAKRKPVGLLAEVGTCCEHHMDLLHASLTGPIEAYRSVDRLARASAFAKKA